MQLRQLSEVLWTKGRCRDIASCTNSLKLLGINIGFVSIPTSSPLSQYSCSIPGASGGRPCSVCNAKQKTLCRNRKQCEINCDILVVIHWWGDLTFASIVSLNPAGKAEIVIAELRCERPLNPNPASQSPRDQPAEICTVRCGRKRLIHNCNSKFNCENPQRVFLTHICPRFESNTTRTKTNSNLEHS